MGGKTELLDVKTHYNHHIHKTDGIIKFRGSLHVGAPIEGQDGFIALLGLSNMGHPFQMAYGHKIALGARMPIELHTYNKPRPFGRSQMQSCGEDTALLIVR